MCADFGRSSTNFGQIDVDIVCWGLGNFAPSSTKVGPMAQTSLQSLEVWPNLAKFGPNFSKPIWCVGQIWDDLEPTSTTIGSMSPRNVH